MTDKEQKCELIERLRQQKRRIKRPAQHAKEGLELSLVDLSDFKLSLTEATPFLWVRAEGITGKSPEEMALGWHEYIRSNVEKQWLAVVLMDCNEEAVRSYAKALRGPELLILGSGTQKEILDAPSLEARFLSILRSEIPLTSLAPYQFGGPVEGSKFFNRQMEVERILRHPNSNFAITGIRRIGKTSLLKEVHRRLLGAGESEARVFFRDCSTIGTPESLITEIVRIYEPNDLRRLERVGPLSLNISNFLKRMSKRHHGTITLMLDEMDRLLEYPRNHYDLPALLRTAVNEDSCRLLVCGFDRLLAELSNSASPYYMLFEPLQIGPFTERNTRELVVSPMQRLGIHLSSEAELVSKIHRDHSGHPALLQFCCNRLIQTLEECGTRTIELEFLDNIYGGNDYKSEIINVFRDNVTPKDKLLVYSLLVTYDNRSSYSQEDMDMALKKHKCRFTPEDIDRACDTLTAGSVFNKSDKHFEFAIPLLPTLLRKEFDLLYLLRATQKEVFA